MKRIMLPLGMLIFVVACGDDSSSANFQWAELRTSSSEESGSSSSRHSGPDPESSSSMDSISSSSFQNDKSSSSVARFSSSSRNNVSSSSHNVILSSSDNSTSSSSEGSGSSSSRHFGPDPESSSSWIASSSSSSRNDVSSSSSEIPTDPSKIFEMRVPKRDAYTCEERGDWGDGVFKQTFSQNDFVCTYDYDGEKGFLYVQLNPISCGLALSLIPGYGVEKAEFYVNGKFADVSDVKYEWGGNHHVQKLWFTYKGKVFRYGQSSLGWGGRPCQGFDCLNVFESDRKTYVVNGCDEQRSIPIVCNGVNAENPVFDFTDKFKVCEGDSRNRGKN